MDGVIMQMFASFMRFIQRYEEVLTASKQCVSNVQYGANYATLLTLTLPSVANSHLGDRLSIIGVGAGGWLLAQNATQVIHVGVTWTIAGVTGSIASTDRSDCVELVCTVEGTTWTAYSVVGSLSVVTA
jgi:hypothetical protein